MTSALLTPTDLKTQLQRHLADDLASVNQILQSSLKSSSGYVSEVVDHVSRFRGKQIRPILLILTNRMLARSSDRKAHMLAAAVEMIHTATLVHDDVIDEAEIRRHVATVHHRWNTETSVLLGDFLFSRAFHLAATTGDADACVQIGRATDRTCEGELNQIAVRLERSAAELDYFRIIRDKTGQLFALSCRLGASAAAGDDAQVRAAAARFGMRLGLAFQIADDVLDLNQSSHSTGKDKGNDLQNGRRTLPVLRALRNGKFATSGTEKAEYQQLQEWLRGERSFQHDEFRELTLIQNGIRSAQDSATELIVRAIRDLQYFPPSDDRQLLESIARFAARRDR